MHKAHLGRALESPWPERLRSRLSMPSWLVSLVLHAAMLLLLAVAVPHGPAGQDEIEGRQVGIVLKRPSPVGEVYEGQAQRQPDDPSEIPPRLAQSLEAAPVDVSQVLPAQDLQVVGPGPMSRPQIETQRAGRNLPASPAAASRSGVPFFGIKDQGRRVVYVVDRSASMQSNRNRLGEAKVELLSSIETLDSMQQFQILFYNERVFAGPRVDQTGRMPFADEAAKTIAGRFVRGIQAYGSTHHKLALQSALRLGPDVIFFLTDADEPVLRAVDLRQIARDNAGRARIHAIEFGVGPDLDDDNFLKQLARDNGGSYRYVDVSKLGR